MKLDFFCYFACPIIHMVYLEHVDHNVVYVFAMCSDISDVESEGRPHCVPNAILVIGCRKVWVSISICFSYKFLFSLSFGLPCVYCDIQYVEGTTMVMLMCVFDLL